MIAFATNWNHITYLWIKGNKNFTCTYRISCACIIHQNEVAIKRIKQTLRAMLVAKTDLIFLYNLIQTVSMQTDLIFFSHWWKYSTLQGHSEKIQMPSCRYQMRGSGSTAPSCWEGLVYVITMFCLKFVLTQFIDCIAHNIHINNGYISSFLLLYLRCWRYNMDKITHR